MRPLPLPWRGAYIVHETHKRRKMTHGKEEKNMIIQDKMYRKAELSQRAEEKENRKLVRCSASLKGNSAVVKNDQTDFRGCPVSDEQLESDHIYELPTAFHLMVQR